MRYWVNPANKRARSGAVTLNMVAEFLEDAGYEIVSEPSANATIGALATPENMGAFDRNPDDGNVMLITPCDGPKALKLDARAGSHLIVLQKKAGLPAAPDEATRRLLARSIVIRARAGSPSVSKLESDIANLIIDIEHFTTCLAQGMNSSNQYQALVDVAEEFFGNFITIVDPNNMLLAYTKHLEPDDEITSSLIRHRYHTEEMLQAERSLGYAAQRISGQESVTEFPPSEHFSATLLTSPIMTNDTYAGYVVMKCSRNDVHTGTKDAFSLFIGFCEKVASLRNDIPAGRNPHSQNLLIALLSRQALDTIFVEQRAHRLGIPAIGSYQLIRIIWPEDCAAQLPFFVDEINRSDPRTRVAVRYENAAMVLAYADDTAALNAITTHIISSFPTDIAYKISTSEILSTLFEVYYAYRTLKCIEKYEAAILRYKKVPDKEKPIMLTFRDAFAFYWNDPLRDTSVDNFAVSHMVTNEIARIDAERRTDDLALLEAFLVNERRASTVAEAHHLHRNGVLYRIKRIQERYGIDLNDHLTRQYVLACLRIRASVHGA